MIVRCPGCGKRISNKCSSCPHCRAAVGGVGEGLDPGEAARRQRRRLRYRLEMQSYAALLLTAIGVAWTFLWIDRGTKFWPTACLAGGALWYVAVRVYWIFTRNRR